MIPEAYNFLSDTSFSNGRPNNLEPLVATNLITILNDAFKRLEDIRQMPNLILDTLEKIFGMICRKFDIQDGDSFILLRPVEGVRTDENWIKQIVNRFNKTIEYRKIWMQNQLKVL